MLFRKLGLLEVSGHKVADHFADVGKMVELGSGGQCKVGDIMLILALYREKCWLVNVISKATKTSKIPNF